MVTQLVVGNATKIKLKHLTPEMTFNGTAL